MIRSATTLLFSNLIFKSFFNFALKAKPNKKPQITFKNWSIVKGDAVQVRTGKDKGKVGKILKVDRKNNRVFVKGVNRRAIFRKNEQSGQSVKKMKTLSIHVSNVGLYDSIVKKAVRIYYAFHPETGQKLRVSKKSGKILMKPKRNQTKRQKRGRNKKLGVKDTAASKAHQVTYQGQNFQAIKKQFEEFIKQKERKQKLLVFNQ